jgi:hypothetical protein
MCSLGAGRIALPPGAAFREEFMKLTVVLGSIVLVAAVAVGLRAQGGGEQTITGCVKGDGTEAKPWTLAGVIILPPAPVPPPGPPGGGRGARGGGGREGGPPAAGGREGAPPAEGGGRGARGGAPAAPPAPPPPPPPPQTFKLSGINMQPWANMRAEVTGTGTNGDFKVSNVRSMWGTCQ